MLGRIVENWLTSATERGYQIAFCQMLAAEGEELLYVASHGPFEKGKDVVTRAGNHEIRAYQLKGGDIRLSDWRGINEQINNLIELPVNLPQLQPITQHSPYFVTNGRVDDVVLDYINTANLGRAQRGFQRPLQVIERSLLITRFVAAHGTYLPQEANDFQSLLTLILADGKAPLEKAKLSALLQGVILFAEGVSAKNVSRSIASAVLLASYILGSAAKNANHWALIEGWVVVSSYIAAAAAKHNLATELWKPSFDLALSGADDALNQLVEECRNDELFIEGNALADGFFYGSRQLILAGLLSAWSLERRRKKFAPDSQIEKIIYDRVRKSFIWGESSAPFVLLSALELEHECKQPFAEGLVIDYLTFVLACNGDGMRGLPDSFITIEESLRFVHSIGDQEWESFQGSSYTCQLAIDFLARRWRRRSLKLAWQQITRLSLESSTPQNGWEWYFWNADSAILESSIPRQPQSWSVLVNTAKSRDTASLPQIMQKNAHFTELFLLVFPHRLTVRTFAAVDTAR